MATRAQIHLIKTKGSFLSTRACSFSSIQPHLFNPVKERTVELNAPPTDKLVATQLKGPDDTPAVLRTHLFVYSLLPLL